MNIQELKEKFNNIEIRNNKIYANFGLKNLLKILKENYNYTLLKEIIAVDYQENGIELIYNLYSPQKNESLKIHYNNTNYETIIDIFDSAIADENEIYDLFGIIFEGNKNIKRLYLPQSWNGHPLKKDYVQNDERLGWNE